MFSMPCTLLYVYVGTKLNLHKIQERRKRYFRVLADSYLCMSLILSSNLLRKSNNQQTVSLMGPVVP